MGEIELKGCPCGRTPTDVDVDGSFGSKWHLVYGNCCAEWHIQFRTNYHQRTTPENKALAIKAWNDAPRHWEKPE